MCTNIHILKNFASLIGPFFICIAPNGLADLAKSLKRKRKNRKTFTNTSAAECAPWRIRNGRVCRTHLLPSFYIMFRSRAKGFCFHSVLFPMYGVFRWERVLQLFFSINSIFDGISVQFANVRRRSCCWLTSHLSPERCERFTVNPIVESLKRKNQETCSTFVSPMSLGIPRNDGLRIGSGQGV